MGSMLANPVWAARPSEMAFATRTLGNAQFFDYRWVDRGGKARALSVALNLDDINRGSAEFAPWDKRDAALTAFKAVQARARELSGDGLTVQPTWREQGYVVELKGMDTPLVRQRAARVEDDLKVTYDKAFTDYAKAHFYTVDRDGETRIITPDHVALVARYTAAMGPVATALKQQILAGGGTERDFMNAALDWLQAIPYDTLQDRYSSNGAGFQTPYGLMRGNKGDCDTKAVAFLALVKAAYPATPVAMIYLPRHAFAGVWVPQGPYDFALATAYGPFVLADPTGPARTPLGEISAEVQDDLHQPGVTVKVVQ